MQIEPLSIHSSPMSSFNRTLFPVPLRPSTASVSPRASVRLSPSNTCCAPNDLWTSRITRTCSPETWPAGWLSQFVSAIVCFMGRKKDQLHQDNVSQNHKQRSQHDGIRCRTPNALGATLRAHSLKT